MATKLSVQHSAIFITGTPEQSITTMVKPVPRGVLHMQPQRIGRSGGKVIVLPYGSNFKIDPGKQIAAYNLDKMTCI